MLLEGYDVSKLLDEEGKFRKYDEEFTNQELPTSSSWLDNFDKERSRISQIVKKYYDMNRNNRINNGQSMDINKKAKYLMDRVILPEDEGGLGLTPEQAAGLAGNIMQESRFNPKAVGDKGEAHGIVQWHSDRRKNINILNTSFEDQVTYMIEELKGPEKNALRRLKLTGDFVQAATVVDHYYERSSKQHTKSRIKYAEDFLKLLEM